MRFAPMSPAATTPSFPEFLTSALQARGSNDREIALDCGVNELALIRYASGAICDVERRHVEHIVSRNEWARGYVVEYVKQRRRKRNAA